MESSIENYVPAPTDIKDGKTRRVFTGVPLDDGEIALVEQFIEYTRSNNIQVPDGILGDDRLALKFMLAAKGNTTNAIKMMNDYIDWLPTLPVPENEVIDLLRRGLVYISGYTRKFNPLIIVNIRKVVDSKIDLDTLLRMQFFLLNWVKDNMLIPGKIETWVVIKDANGVGATQMPVKLIKGMTAKFAIYYCHRIERSFVLNVPYMMNAVWKIVSMFIDAETLKKITIARSGWEQMLANLISPENLEEKYGGIMPNKEDDFWPFNRN